MALDLLQFTYVSDITGSRLLFVVFCLVLFILADNGFRHNISDKIDFQSVAPGTP